MSDLFVGILAGLAVALASRAMAEVAAGSWFDVGAVATTSPPGRRVRWSVPRLRGLVDGAEAAQTRDRAVLEVLATLGETLRSGGSLELGLATAARDVSSPVGPALREVLERIALGETFDAATERWEREVGGDEARLLAATLRMHRRSGGSLAAVLANLAASVRDRLDVAAELRALTAQARLSAWIVGSLPVGFLVFLGLISGPGFLAVFLTPVGAILFFVGGTLQAAAAVWIRRILAVDA